MRIFSTIYKRSHESLLNGDHDHLDHEPFKKVFKHHHASSSVPNIDSLVPPPPADIDLLANGDTASIIFSFLDCRELLHMACSSKLLMERLSYDHVIRSSMMHGGHATTSIQRVVSLVKDRRIYVPTPLRMLRIANGKRCENCGRDKVNLLSADFGVFFGRKCCLDGTTKWSKSVRNNSNWSAILSEPRMARSDSSTKTQVFARPFGKFGEPHGPVLTASCWTELCEQREGAVVELLKQRDQHDPTDARRREGILRAHAEVAGVAQKRKEERELEYIKKQDQSWAMFIKRSEAVVQRLETELKGVPGARVKLDAASNGSREQKTNSCFFC